MSSRMDKINAATHGYVARYEECGCAFGSVVDEGTVETAQSIFRFLACGGAYVERFRLGNDQPGPRPFLGDPCAKGIDHKLRRKAREAEEGSIQLWMISAPVLCYALGRTAEDALNAVRSDVLGYDAEAEALPVHSIEAVPDHLHDEEPFTDEELEECEPVGEIALKTAARIAERIEQSRAPLFDGLEATACE